MDPHEAVTCNLLRAKLSAECCARRYLSRVGVAAPRPDPCGTCQTGATVSTCLLDAGWTPARGQRADGVRAANVGAP